MKSRMLPLLALLFVSCNSDPGEADMQEGFKANPVTHKRNAVIGAVTFNDRAIPGATITIVQTSESIPVRESGAYTVVLDPEKLGTNTHELVFSAPGYKDERRTVTIPEWERIELDVELVPEDQ